MKSSSTTQMHGAGASVTGSAAQRTLPMNPGRLLLLLLSGNSLLYALILIPLFTQSCNI